MSDENLQVQLARRPTGWVEVADLRLHSAPIPEPADGEVLVRNLWLSLDPYMRGRMSDAKSYAEPVALGAVMVGGTAGEVLRSRHPDFRPGDKVVGMLGWQLYGCAPGKALAKVDASRVPLQAYLGTLGMPGVTAWYGLNRICEPRPGETVVVTAASGAVGAVVGQLAKARGCRVVGVAGGPAKCRYVTEELGFDACVDYKAGQLGADLREALGEGFDCLFENVGGEIFDRLLALARPFARIALCGTISDYNATEPYPMRNVRAVLVSRLKLQGFIVSDHMECWPQALGELAALAIAGKLRWRESVAEGLASAPQAFIGMLRGENFGKQLVRLG